MQVSLTFSIKSNNVKGRKGTQFWMIEDRKIQFNLFSCLSFKICFRVDDNVTVQSVQFIYVIWTFVVELQFILFLRNFFLFVQWERSFDDVNDDDDDMAVLCPVWFLTWNQWMIRIRKVDRHFDSKKSNFMFSIPFGWFKIVLKWHHQYWF